MKQKYIILILSVILSVFNYAQPRKYSLLNYDHLNKLYEEVDINNIKSGIIHIYCDYPDYKWTDAAGEGITCIDDCARAAIVYMNEYKLSNKKEHIDKAKKLTRFILYLQSENGFFYNFVYKDLTINKAGITSVDEPNWWSWRALWELAEAYSFFLKYDPAFAKEIAKGLTTGMEVAMKWLDVPLTELEINGFKLPGSLPFQTASDQAAVIIKSLAPYYNVTKEKKALDLINKLSNAIVKMQAGSHNEFPYYAFLSWQTNWHAWGNNQAEALLLAYKITKNKKYFNAAVKEIEHFYPYMIRENFLNEFEIEKISGKINIKKTVKYSQIAYGIAPMILACTEAYAITKNIKYANSAYALSKWFFGFNMPKKVMYHSQSGGCYDGVNDSVSVNKNMGAESTIEALFAMQALEQHGIIKKHWNRFYKKYSKE